MRVIQFRTVMTQGDVRRSFFCETDELEPSQPGFIDALAKMAVIVVAEVLKQDGVPEDQLQAEAAKWTVTCEYLGYPTA